MLSTRTRYSIIALSDIARGTDGRARDGVPISLVEVAERHGLPLCYLEQLAVRWRKAGLVRGVRGPAGGYLLKRPAADISIADIATAMEEAVSCIDVGLDVERARAAGCPAQRILDIVTAQVQRSLSAISLKDVACGRFDIDEADGLAVERPALPLGSAMQPNA
jgi:Rrf2 family iron-sulfur cluster assembly transcriptional regulator